MSFLWSVWMFPDDDKIDLFFFSRSPIVFLIPIIIFSTIFSSKFYKKKMIIRRFRVKVCVEVDAVTCPGVWLCPYGRVELTFRTMGYNFKTNGLEARFPLLFHEKFHMEGFYQDGVETLAKLEARLASERVDFALYQRGTRLAFFTGHLGTLLRSKSQTCHPEIHSQILMRPTQSFPGILAPKIEILTRVEVHENTPGLPAKIYYALFGTEVHRIERPCDGLVRNTSGTCLRCPRLRQMPVCHVRESHEPRRCSNYPHRFAPIHQHTTGCASADNRSRSCDSDDEDTSVVAACAHSHECRNHRGIMNEDAHSSFSESHHCSRSCDICSAYRNRFLGHLD
ncbi:uncharacterized protein LOC129795790 [Lutzomyia longipalpis]|uniref:uncharacterized protein LOC129795790 n=1 Tax=Lutzomyia longipalpis TaxID=7200 RepID=UPI00248454DB|nr:uncharacterized protein LOC129795790 [Lutzomyia longipalpis]